MPQISNSPPEYQRQLTDTDFDNGEERRRAPKSRKVRERQRRKLEAEKEDDSKEGIPRTIPGNVYVQELNLGCRRLTTFAHSAMSSNVYANFFIEKYLDLRALYMTPHHLW